MTQVRPINQNIIKKSKDEAKTLGQVFTPKEIADLIAYWAIRNRSDLVLDPAAGTGVFIDAAIERLKRLGAVNPSKQIYAIEIDSNLFSILKNKYKDINLFNINYLEFPQLQNTLKPDKPPNIPKVDAIIGNPPYIERQLLRDYPLLKTMYPEVPSLADIYVYFIVHSLRFLKDGGRLGFITSDSWLTVKFGNYLKELLLSKYSLKTIIYFDKRIFNELVGSTIIFAEKCSDESINKSPKQILFIRVKKLTPTILENIKRVLDGNRSSIHDDIKVVQISADDLSPKESWLIHAYGIKAYTYLRKRDLMTPLYKLADVSIGLFTLANSFFIIDEIKKKKFNIEKKFLRKIISSTRKLKSPIIKESDVNDYVLYCSSKKEELVGTNVIKYIEWGEKQKVKIRGKDKYVIGYNNTPRIKAAGRNPWYNLVPEINKRCIKPIIFPRRIYEKFIVAWNKDGLVLSDNFIGIEPKCKKWLFPLLAVLNSTITEYMARILGHLYGGGVCDLTPNIVKNLLVLDLSALSESELQELEIAFKNYIKTLNRDIVDKTIMKILRLSNEEFKEVLKELNDIKKIQKDR